MNQRFLFIAVIAMLLALGLAINPDLALDVAAQQEGETITVQGMVTQYLDDDEVIFSDGVNSAQVEFLDDSVNLPPLNTQISMTVYIDKAEQKDNEYEVRLVSWEPVGGEAAPTGVVAPASPAPVVGSSGGLLDGIPEPANAEFRAENAMSDGGRHFLYTTGAAPGDVVGSYQAALEAAGWTIVNSGGGGDPFGLFGGGAGLTATYGDRYLKFNAGGPVGQTFIDACVWPTQPSDDDCDQDNRSGQGVMGAGGDLLAGVPELANVEFQAEDAIQEGGRHFFFKSTASPADVVGGYQAALEAAGWAIESSGGGGDPFGMFASGAGLTTNDGTRYITVNAGGPSGQIFVDACIWPAKPNDTNCGQNNNDNNAQFGGGGDLLADVPEPANAQFNAEDAIQEGGRHFFYTINQNPGDAVSAYQNALQAAGWTIVSSGGDPMGVFGGGLSATNGDRYLTYNVGGPGYGTSYIDACVWPAKPDDTNCSQNQQSSGNAQLGSGGDLLAGVPEPADAEFQAEDAIQEGGRHYFYISSAAPGDVVSNYQNALQATGWTIVSSGGDPMGMFGAGLTATNGPRYLTINAGGHGGGQTFIDGCVWPRQPNVNNCGQNNNTSGAGTMGAGGELLAGVPELHNAEFKSENGIHEGGRHFFFMSDASPSDVVNPYQAALENAGWTIVSSGGGGDPFGLFGGGAGLTATNGPRYLKLNAGGQTGGPTFIDGCIWPTQPNDNDCDQDQRASGAGTMGSSGDLTAGVTELQNAEFKAEDAIQEGGRHFFFTSGAAPADLVSGYQTALEAAGWTILNSGGGGDPFGMFGGGAGLTATDGTRHLVLNAGGPAGQTFVDGCIWPSQPGDDNCGQNNN